MARNWQRIYIFTRDLHYTQSGLGTEEKERREERGERREERGERMSCCDLHVPGTSCQIDDGQQSDHQVILFIDLKD